MGIVGAAIIGPLPDAVKVNKYPKTDVPFDLPELKSKWRQRIQAIKMQGKIPIIDIESSFNPKKLNAKRFAKQMDKNGVALVAFSPQVGRKAYQKKGKLWSDAVRRLLNLDPWRYIPVTTAGIYPAWTKDPEAFLAETLEKADEENYPLLGEFEFRHYPSPRQYKRGEMYRDVTISITSPVAHRLFAFSAKTGIPFQIHYEIEDRLLPSLESMLKKYPKARVIWCHLAQIRYSKRARRYGPAYVRQLIETYPNLYFDLAFGGPNSTYPGSGEYQARIWDRSTGKVKKEWVALISKYPWRFLAAIDLGGDRMDQLPEKTRKLRRFLGNFPRNVQEIIAYKAAWKLLFSEDI